MPEVPFFQPSAFLFTVVKAYGMSPLSHASAFRDARFVRQADFQLQREQRAELHRSGSLSKRLQRWCTGRLPVTVLRQGHCRPTRDEAHMLGLRPREGVWLREVWLGPPEAPWITGRTVTPLREMKGRMQALRNLGTRPLGSVLFTGPAWRRSPFLVGCLLPRDRSVPPLPARRSVFYYGPSRLLVTEGFCTAYWRRLGDESSVGAGVIPRNPAERSPVQPTLVNDHV